MSFTPTTFVEGTAPGLSAAEMNKLGTQYDETVSDLSPHMQDFYEIATSGSHTASGTSAWEDWDISAIVPADTKYVEVVIKAGAAHTAGVRENGTSNDRTVSNGGGGLAFRTCKCDSNRIIEIYTTYASTYFYITGYWK